MICRFFKLIWIFAWYELSLDISCRRTGFKTVSVIQLNWSLIIQLDHLDGPFQYGPSSNDVTTWLKILLKVDWKLLMFQGLKHPLELTGSSCPVENDAGERLKKSWFHCLTLFRTLKYTFWFLKRKISKILMKFWSQIPFYLKLQSTWFILSINWSNKFWWQIKHQQSFFTELHRFFTEIILHRFR